MKGSLCLATIGDTAFVTGLRVLLHSFLAENPWFDGDIVVFDNDMDDSAKSAIGRVGPVRFVTPSDELLRRVQRIMARQDDFRRIYPRFFTLEAFRLEGWDRVVFLDGDVLVCGDIRELFEGDGPLRAAADGPVFRGCGREFNGFRETPLGAAGGTGRIIARPFNSGVLSIGPACRGPAVFARILEEMDRIDWRGAAEVGLTDQYILNRCFDGGFEEVSPIYNWNTSAENVVAERTGLNFFDARVLHYTGQWKPWRPYSLAQLARHAPGQIKHLELWHLYAAALVRGAGCGVSLEDRIGRVAASEAKHLERYSEKPKAAAPASLRGWQRLLRPFRAAR